MSAARGGTTPTRVRVRRPVAPVLVLVRAEADWSKLFSPQPEIWDYLQGVAEKYGLRRYIRFDSHVDRAHWDDSEYRWHVFTADGQEYIAQFLISGAGALHIPLIPDIDGQRRIRAAPLSIPPSGTTASTSPASGSRSSGPARAPSRSCPQIVTEVSELQLYQRTRRGWCHDPTSRSPRPSTRLRLCPRAAARRCAAASTGATRGVGFAMTRRPGLLRAVQVVGSLNIRRAVKDKELRRKLTPTIEPAASES